MRPILTAFLWLAAVFSLVSCSGEKASTEASLMSINPSSGSGLSRRFSIHFPDRGSGHAKLSYVQVLFGNADPASPPFCFVHYDAQGNGLKLYRGPGPLDFSPAAAPGVPSGVLQNDSCQIDSTSSSASNSSQGLTLDLTVNFGSSMAGDRVVYGRTFDDQALDSGWRRIGAWTIPATAK
jgi:hypothetical protein